MNTGNDVEVIPINPRQTSNRMAKKSTSSPSQQQQQLHQQNVQQNNAVSVYSTRRQAAMANSTQSALPSNTTTYKTRERLGLRPTDKFMQNFNPETSAREKRKLIRKINPPSNVKRPFGALYDENGVHIQSGSDLCDCLNEDCLGCFFECSKCGSQKCGTECRVHRKFLVDQIDYHGYDNGVRCPFMRK